MSMSMLVEKRLLDTDWCRIVDTRLAPFPARRSWHRVQDFGIERAINVIQERQHLMQLDRVKEEWNIPRFLCLQARHQPKPRIGS